MTQINFQTLSEQFTPLTEQTLKENWERLHRGDLEPEPETQEALNGWLLFHNGHYLDAAEQADGDPSLLTLRLKSLSTYAHYLEQDAERKIERFKDIIQLCEHANGDSQEADANVHYQRAYSLGRYGQFISVAKALAEGLAGQIDESLHRCLSLSPNHADAHTALATYQAEIIGKLGKLAAKLTYKASPDAAVQLYEKAIDLAPESISAKTEYADGLIQMGGRKQIKAATALYQQAVSQTPMDALESMDWLLAKQELEDA